MRIESPRPLKNGGFLHRSARSSKVEQSVYNRQVVGSTPTAPIDFRKLIDRWRKEKAGELESFAATLGVKQQDLVDLHTCWAPDHHAFAFPMYDGTGNVVGIRLRSEHFYWSVKGSHSGLFIPYAAISRLPIDYILITEGPTDTAAALTLGFFAIGRPACRGSEQLIVEVLNELPMKDVIIVQDNDEHIDKYGRLVRPGAAGAESLCKRLGWPFKVKRFIPPTKDLRDFLTAGGTRRLFLSLT